MLKFIDSLPRRFCFSSSFALAYLSANLMAWLFMELMVLQPTNPTNPGGAGGMGLALLFMLLIHLGNGFALILGTLCFAIDVLARRAEISQSLDVNFSKTFWIGLLICAWPTFVLQMYIAGHDVTRLLVPHFF